MQFKKLELDSDEDMEAVEEAKTDQIQSGDTKSTLSGAGAKSGVGNKAILDSIVKDTFNDRAFGCIIGAFVADACGSYNEFAQVIQTEQFMNECMKMPGGGPWNNGPGQITDDSELAMCLMHGLVENCEVKDGETVMSTRGIAKYYGQWVYSGPYDIGMATNSALSPLCGNP